MHVKGKLNLLVLLFVRVASPSVPVTVVGSWPTAQPRVWSQWCCCRSSVRLSARMSPQSASMMLSMWWVCTEYINVRGVHLGIPDVKIVILPSMFTWTPCRHPQAVVFSTNETAFHLHLHFVWPAWPNESAATCRHTLQKVWKGLKAIFNSKTIICVSLCISYSPLDVLNWRIYFFLPAFLHGKQTFSKSVSLSL